MTYVLSDIHGNLSNFHSILQQITLCPEDSLYILGDVIDRHPHGIELLRDIMTMPNTHMLLGNHEYMMMRALGFPYDGEDDLDDELDSEGKLNHWYQNGGGVTHEAWKQLSHQEQSAIKAYLLALPLNIYLPVNEKNFLLCHASPEILYHSLLLLDMVNDAPGTLTYFCVWERDYVQVMAEKEGFITVFGHTPTMQFQNQNPLCVYQNRNLIGIDCGSGFPPARFIFEPRGRLACIRLEDMKIYYSA